VIDYSFADKKEPPVKRSTWEKMTGRRWLGWMISTYLSSYTCFFIIFLGQANSAFISSAASWPAREQRSSQNTLYCIFRAQALDEDTCYRCEVRNPTKMFWSPSHTFSCGKVHILARNQKFL